MFEQTPTIEGSYKDSGLTWEQVYFQAELPTQEGDAYKIVLRQGKKGDNQYQSAIRYISYDKGETSTLLNILFIRISLKRLIDLG